MKASLLNSSKETSVHLRTDFKSILSLSLSALVAGMEDTACRGQHLSIDDLWMELNNDLEGQVNACGTPLNNTYRLCFNGFILL